MLNRYFTRQLILNNALGGTIWDFFSFLPKVNRVLLKATKVTIKHKDPFFPKEQTYTLAKGQILLQELEEGLGM